MIYILWGQDDFSLNQSFAEIKSSISDELLESNTTILDGEHLTLDKLSTVCNAAPFLSERRLVVVRGLLGRFEPATKSGRGRKAVLKVAPLEGYKLWVDYMTAIPDSSILVLIDSALTGNNPLLKELSKIAEVKFFPLLKGAQLLEWIKRRVARENGSISFPAVALLAKLVGSNLWVMASEIDKLVQYASGRRIEEADVNKLVSYAQQPNVFAMVDAILGSKVGIAERLLQELLQAGAAPAYLLVMLSRQVQRVLRTKALKGQMVTRTQIQNKLGLTQDFVLNKTLEQADRYTLERLKRVYRKLLEADLSIKTGRYSGELALNILVAELCQ